MELRNGRGQIEMIFCIFSGPLRPSPAPGRKNVLQPAGRKLRRKARNGAGEGRRGPEKVLRKMCVFEPFGLSFPFILAFWAFILLSFWPFGLSFPFILAFCAFISFHFGLLNLHFLSFWPFGPSFPFILAFWAFISFHFGLLGFHFLSFWPFGLSFPSFWPFGPSFPFILAF